MSKPSPYPVERNCLFFKQWRYCIVIRYRHAACLRQLSHKSIEATVSSRNQWGSLRGGSQRINDEEQQGLYQMCDWLLSRPAPYKKVICNNGIWIYTNDLLAFETVETDVPNSSIIQTTVANVSLTPDAVTLAEPKHQFRTYFRNRWLNEAQADQLSKYFINRRDLFRLSPGFSRVVTNRTNNLQSYHFVDHNEPNADFLIGIACPGMIRKTMPIVPKTK